MSYIEPFMHDLQSPIKSTIHLLSEVEDNALCLKKKKTDKQTNKNKQTLILETSELNTKEEFLKPLSTGDREKNEVIMTNRN